MNNTHMEVASKVSQDQHNSPRPMDGSPDRIPESAIPPHEPSAALLPRYDFRRAPGASSDVAAFAELHERFASLLVQRLTDRLGAIVEARPAIAEVLRYDEFIYSLSQTSCLAILRADPPGAQCCCDLALPIAYRIIDRLLGKPSAAAGSSDQRPDRALTRIEQGLILPAIETIASALGEAYSADGIIMLREESLESAPAEIRIMPPDEQVLVVRFDLTVAQESGRLSLCLPAPLTDLLRDPDAIAPTSLTRHARQAQRQDVAQNLLDASLELRAVLAETRLRLSDVLTLNEGDVITTNRAASLAGPEASLQIQGSERFIGELGQVDGRRALAITRSSADFPARSGPGGNP
jgi:flagellar motor switch protein FliM